MLSFIVIDSRSDKHPDWVGVCINSIMEQIEEVELILVDNVGREKTIGQCWNEGVREAKGEWCVFVGDDDWVAPDYSQILRQYIEKVKGRRIVNVSTNMTAYEEATGRNSALARQSTGAWLRKYLLAHPFNEELKKGVDREYIEEMVKRGDQALIVQYYFGYFYRKHDDYSCAGDIQFIKETKDIYFICNNKAFLEPITGKINCFVDNRFTPKLAEKAKVIWCEWLNEHAFSVADFKCDAKKILRIHSFEAFHDDIKYIDLSKFDTVVFVAEHIKEFVDTRHGKLDNAIVVPNGVQVDKFTLKRERNNKIAYAGYLSRKKGIGELELIARSLPDYKFHVAGKFQEDDVAWYFRERLPDNVIIEPWQYDINRWFQDKTYILNTSMRESQGMSVMEGMACGLKPIVRDWIGAREIYGDTWSSTDDIKQMLESEYEPERYREYIEQNYNFKTTFNKIQELINEYATSTC